MSETVVTSHLQCSALGGSGNGCSGGVILCSTSVRVVHREGNSVTLSCSRTALHYASSRGSSACVTVLLEVRADPNLTDAQVGPAALGTALFQAASLMGEQQQGQNDTMAYSAQHARRCKQRVGLELATSKNLLLFAKMLWTNGFQKLQ